MGSLVIGEIKVLNGGKMEVSTDGMGTVEIEWLAVVRIHSTQLFDVDTSDGKSYTGFVSSAAAGQCAIEGPWGYTELELADIVHLTEFEEEFWGRWTGISIWDLLLGRPTARQISASMQALSTLRHSFGSQTA